MIQKGDVVFFLHDNKIRTGILRQVFDNNPNWIRWYLEVDFLAHRGLSINDKKCFESIELLIENLRSEYEGKNS